MVVPQSRDVELLSNRVTDFIARYRNWLLGFVAFLQLISFNGRWRLGLDTAEYRGLALGIVTGKGYEFNDWAKHQIYPGLPYLLAGVDYALGPANRKPSPNEQRRLLGPSPATSASVMIIVLMGLVAIVLSYQVMRFYYPVWAATTIAFCVGCNYVFLQHSHELLTDVPFLCGVVMSFYGWELLRRAGQRGRMLRAIAMVIGGLVLAASMRPTFWILALAWIVACVWGLITGPRRFHAIALTLLLLVWAGMIFLDPRFKGMNPLAGGYEHEALDVFFHRIAHPWHLLYQALHDQLPAAVFGQAMAPAGILSSILLIVAVGFFLFKHPLWTLTAWGIFFVTLGISSVPRYYMMVLPILLLGWLYCFCFVARRVPQRWGEIILGIGLALVVLNNLTGVVRFIVEQRHPDFFRHYRKGDFVTTLKWADIIRKHVKPDQKMIAPFGSTLGILSGVHVYTQKEFFPRGAGHNAPQILAQTGLNFAILPAKLYRSKEPAMTRLIKRGVIMPVKLVKHGPGRSFLYTIDVVIPSTDWRKLTSPPSTRPATSTKPAHPATRRARRPSAR